MQVFAVNVSLNVILTKKKFLQARTISVGRHNESCGTRSPPQFPSAPFTFSRSQSLCNLIKEGADAFCWHSLVDFR